MTKNSKNYSLTRADDGDISSYISKVMRFPLLTAKEEHDYAVRLRESGDIQAAQALVVSHLRIVPKVVFHYKGYGLPLSDMISEGNLGLMQAVKNFDPDRGFRLVTYALWWVRASIQDYILRSWSIVKIASSSSQKRLFFQLRKLKSKIGAFHGLTQTDALTIAKQLEVTPDEVASMDARLSGDLSLQAQIGGGQDDSFATHQDMLVDHKANQEQTMAQSQETSLWRKRLAGYLRSLSSRERFIFWSRRLKENATTLETLSWRYKISSERIRQIETRAFEKIRSLTLGAIDA